MLELILCSLFTVLPDYLFRRYGQGKRFGREITLYSVWYVLRYGIIGCVMLTVLLITIVFYFHPSTSSASILFRSVPILTERTGRVAEIHVGLSEDVAAGQPLFTLDSTAEAAAAETARRRLAEIDAEAVVARSDLASADAVIAQADGAFRQAVEELATSQELAARNPNVVAARELERKQIAVDSRRGGLDAAIAAKRTLEIRLETLLPAQRASAEADLARAQVDIDKSVVRAGFDGRVEQFALRPGEIVSPIMRPAGVLVPKGAGGGTIVAGFGQIEAQVLRVGLIGEVSCAALPLTVIPVVVVDVQRVIASGQVRAGDTLIDVASLARPGSILAFMEPLFEGGLDALPPGANCIANAYSNHHDELAEPGVGAARWLFLHVVDATALVHALILRGQTLMLPIMTLVLGGAH